MTSNLLVKERKVDTKESGTKLRNFIVHQFRQELAIRADAIAALRQKRVRVNGAIVLDSYQLKEGDLVRVEIDPIQAIKSRLHSLDIELRHAEDGLVVLAKAPGVSCPDVEWAAPALLLVSRETQCVEIEGCQLNPWIAVNTVEKSIRGLVLVVDTEERRNAVLQLIKSGKVVFGICALCQGSADQDIINNASAESIATSVNQTVSDGANRLDMWYADNGLPSDVFDNVDVEVLSTWKSSSVGRLSVVKGLVRRTVKPGLVLRRFLYELGHPVVGMQTYSLPLPNHRDKGVLLSIVSIEMPSLTVNDSQISVSDTVPPKFQAVCERESRFYRQRQEKARTDIADVGEYSKNASISFLTQQSETDSDTMEGVEVDVTKGKPVAYISGFKRFCGYAFHVTPDTLIPRPSTETLASTTVEHLKNQTSREPEPVRIMDLGTGNGCILLSVLLCVDGVRGIGIDISDPALEVARRNCELHFMQDRAIFLTGCFGSFALDPLVMAQGPFDFIACNPPYISDRKANRMRATIGHEPQLALIAKDGGYQAYRDICRSLEANLSILRTGGSIGFEIGKDMAGGVRRIFSRWKETGAFEDQHGFLRVIVFQRPASV
ncbi:hypothetical protein H4217_002662 [Coemansia sp. RSA 1939]|nr:hypothetical protein H4217_002662 [Coemansia sp. RSA 1939]KAJ2607673.1 hypothetical protein EV177_005384 [Coemansia sp. RSA 1804]